MHTPSGWREPWSFPDSGTPSGPLPSVAAVLPERAGDPQRRNQSGMMMTVVGEMTAILKTLEQLQQVAATDSTVLLLGETGTGKELFATHIHASSARRGRPMVRVNCSAIPATLIESELFGREKGAFTGALARQIGRFELADHSTIFLDEIGDLPSEVQVKLLRVLEERQIERLGSPKPIRVDVRIIAATHRNLEQRIADGSVPRRPVLPAQRLSRSRCRRCASASKTSRCSSGASSTSSRRPSASGLTRSPRRTWWRCSGTPGRATSASCATSSSGR